MSWGFAVLLTAVTIATSGYIAWFFEGARKNDWRWVGKDSRDTYVRIADTMITSSGIAVTLLMTLGRSGTPRWMLHRATLALVVSIVFTVFFILIFVRNAEVAMARHSDECARKGTGNGGGIGPLTNKQLLWTLLTAWVAVTSFLWGFLYLGRLALRI